MCYMITARHLDVGPLTAEDIAKEQGMTGRFKESTCKSEGRVPVIPHVVAGSEHQ